MIIKSTHESSNAFYSAIDIAQRAALAVNRHPKFFNSATHKLRVYEVENAGRDYFCSWKAIYTTARPATRFRKVHTEVKFNKVVFPTRKKELARQQFINNLRAIGIDPHQEIIYKPNTNSISILVF